MKAVELNQIIVRYGKLAALDSATLELRGGEATMLIGPNGAGKSTLMKVLLGLIRPDGGALRVDGERRGVDNDWRARVGYLPEAVAFSENLTGRQVMSFFARARGVSRERAEDVLKKVGLFDARKRAVRGYSRGMRQRLGLGVAIVSQPQLLILDEPTAGLDQEGLAVLWQVMDDWRAAGRMVLVSTHEVALMERHIDAICVLRKGKVLTQGTAEALRDAAGLPHRVHLAVDERDASRVELLCEAMEKWGKARIGRDGAQLSVEVAPEALLELMEIQASFAGTVRNIRVEEPTMDLVYDKLLGVA